MISPSGPACDPPRDFPSGKAVALARAAVSAHLRPGDWALDATAGNGHDTLFLALAVGPHGRVFAMDLQSSALAATRLRLEAADIEDTRVTLIPGDHAQLADLVPPEAGERLHAVMFNLGYLPGSDKACRTQPGQTLAALQSALSYLAPGGLLTVVAYPGHLEGAEERDAVCGFVSALDPSLWESLHYHNINRPGDPPELFVVRRVR